MAREDRRIIYVKSLLCDSCCETVDGLQQRHRMKNWDKWFSSLCIIQPTGNEKLWIMINDIFTSPTYDYHIQVPNDWIDGWSRTKQQAVLIPSADNLGAVNPPGIFNILAYHQHLLPYMWRTTVLLLSGSLRVCICTIAEKLPIRKWRNLLGMCYDKP